VACATGLSVNRTLKVELNCEKIILNFKLISRNKNYINFNNPLSLSLGLKIIKSSPRNPLIKGYAIVPRAHPNFLNCLGFEFFGIALTKLFKYSITICTPIHQGGIHPLIPRVWWGAMVWEIST